MTISVQKLKGKCWLSTQKLEENGYARIVIKRKKYLAHRISYILFKNRIPCGKEIDHLCRVRHCFNPEHLEAVWPKENKLRGNGWGGINKRKKFCKRGHPLSGKNLMIIKTHKIKNGRGCKMCKRNWTRDWRAKKCHLLQK